MSRNKLVLSHVGYALKDYYYTRALVTSAKKTACCLQHPPLFYCFPRRVVDGAVSKGSSLWLNESSNKSSKRR